MHALNRSDRTMPVIAGNYLRRLRAMSWEARQ